MLEDQRGEASYIFIPDGIAFCAKLGQRSVDVDRIPQHNDIYNESQCTQLVFLNFPIPLEQLALFAVKYHPCQFITAVTLSRITKIFIEVSLYYNICHKRERLAHRHHFDTPRHLLR